MSLTTGAACLALLFLLPMAAVLRRPLASLLKLGARALAGLGSLWLLRLVGGTMGLSLGVNLLNALVLALLGTPGLGLLLMLDWMGKL